MAIFFHLPTPNPPPRIAPIGRPPTREYQCASRPAPPPTPPPPLPSAVGPAGRGRCGACVCWCIACANSTASASGLVLLLKPWTQTGTKGMQEANMGCVASADWRITSKMALAKCYLVFCGQQTPTFTYQTKSQSTFATKGKAFCALHRNPCRAHITINDFQGGKCAKSFSGFCCCKCSPSPTKPSRQALLPHFLLILESPTCTQVEQHHIFNGNVAKNAH